MKERSAAAAKTRGVAYRLYRTGGRRRKRDRLVVYAVNVTAGLLLVGGAGQSAMPVPASHRVTNAGPSSAPTRQVSGTSIALRPVNEARPRGARVTGLFLASPAGVGIPATVLGAYRRSAAKMAAREPGCHLTWPLLAGIGKVESDNADGGDVAPDGELLHPILGPVLDGRAGTGAVPNAVGTEWGQSGPWARAVGPMQFLPATWMRWGSDGNGDRVADPDNIFDASLAAARYLCSGGGNLSTSAGLSDAIFSYNHSWAYVAEVAQWMRTYQTGGVAVPDDPAAADLVGFSPPENAGQSEAVSPRPVAGGNRQGHAASSTRSALSSSPAPSQSPAPSPAPAPSKMPAPSVLSAAGHAVNGVLRVVRKAASPSTAKSILGGILDG